MNQSPRASNSSDQGNQQKSMISLAKLRDYMPQNHTRSAPEIYQKIVSSRYRGNDFIINAQSPRSTVDQSTRARFINLRLNQLTKRATPTQQEELETNKIPISTRDTDGVEPNSNELQERTRSDSKQAEESKRDIELRRIHNKNNMTPSSLLLLQNHHNYIEQDPHQHRSNGGYNATTSDYFMRSLNPATSSDATTINEGENQHQGFNTALVNNGSHFLQNNLSNVRSSNYQQADGTNNRNMFDDGSLHPGNQDTNTLAAAQHQAMSSINQYYSNHNNLIPTSSSKSSSSASTNSTPSPKINMHTSSGQHPNHIISSALATNSPTPSRAHLDHLNQHYVNDSALSGTGVQQHHHTAQNYTYGQTPTSSSNLHLAMSDHDQSYSHHQLNQSLPQQQQQHHQPQQPQMQQHQQQNIQNQQALYQQMAHNVGVNNIYGSHGNVVHYQGHLQTSTSNAHQVNAHMMPSGHQDHLNTAAAARAAAAVVSQTLKTVANHQTHQHQYGSSIANLGTTTGSLMNITASQHQQFHPMNQVNHHHHHHHLTNHHHLSNNQAQQQQPSLVLNHSASSIATRKYQCKMCPQVFMSKAEMRYHNQNHMREAKPYKCLQCPKAFANSSYLSQHMRIHQGVKPYTCDICSRKFTQLSHLQQHKRTHTGDKPYKCTYMSCTKQFSQLSNLQSHSRCHQLDKPYKCNSCYKCFHDEQSLLEHIPRHLESKHLKKNLCIFCGSSYQQERGLVKHFQQYHTDKSPTLVAAAIAAGTTGNMSLIASLISSSTTNGNSINNVVAGGGVNSTNGSNSGLGGLNMAGCIGSSHD